MLKKWFPLSFKYTDSVTSLVIGIIIYVVVGILAGLVIGLANILFGWIPLLGSVLALIFKVLGALIDVYVTAGIVIQVLVFCKVIKE
jgi:uncharacterized oligopeptide transporter (OPT) family protein